MIFKKKSKAKCPYCGIELEKPPKRKKKCPSCKEPIYPRTNPYTNRLYYLTEEGKEEFYDKIQKRYYLEDRFLKEFSESGLTKRHFEKRRKDYEKKARKLNQEYNGFAFLTLIFNELSLNKMKQKHENKFHDLKMMYFSMARLLYDYNQNFFNFLKESSKMELYDFQQQEKQSGIKMKVAIIAAPGGNNPSCDKCLEQNGKKFTIDEALEKMPIPVEACGNGFCRCVYGSVIE